MKRNRLLRPLPLVMGAALAGPALGQEATKEATKPKVKNQETYKVTGSRIRGLNAEDASAPVDVIFGDDVNSQGTNDLNDMMRTVVPSYNVNTQPISDAGTFVRPANLRGLSPDSTLILVNGKRRHRSAVISFLGQGISDGAQGPDISVIPSIALKRVEVLRDGAAAQYGSDAIAGVINFVLKDAPEGGSFEAKYGSTYEGDGGLQSYSGNLGFPLLRNGFGNVSFELSQQDATSRSVQRDDAAQVAGAEDPAQTWGAPETRENVKVFANFSQDITENLEFYAFGNYASREVENGFYYRNPNSRANVYTIGEDDDTRRLIGDLNLNDGQPCPQDVTPSQSPDSLGLNSAECFMFNQVLPGGFTPSFGAKITDRSGVAGLRGNVGIVDYDLSGSVGQNTIDFFIRDTVNASLGGATPREFKPGQYIQRENAVNLDLNVPIPAPFFASDINVAFGLETRVEEFEVIAGQEESWVAGPLADQGFSAGSNGFHGFSPDMEGVFDRRSNAAYTDVEADITSSLRLGVAGRWEDYDDFGTTSNGKVSGRYRFSDNFALRSTYGTGFRAPTPGQSNVSNITTAIYKGQLANAGTIPPTHPLAVLKGGEELRPETSVHQTFGAMFGFNKFKGSLDFFRIDVNDRLGQSGKKEITDADIAAVGSGLETNDLRTIRFYTNAFDTRTEGFDLLLSHPVNMMGGVTNFAFNGNYTKTTVQAYDPDVVDDKRIRQLEDGLPTYRYHLTASHWNGPWRTMARVNYYDDYFEAHMDDASFPIEAGSEYTLDLEMGYTFGQSLSVIVGAQNATNELPDHNPYRGVSGSKYPETSPMGFNGGFYYTRLVYVL